MLWLMSLALGADLLVGPAQPYLTIDGALDDALDGDRLLVAPGSYVEPELAIGDRTLTLEATAPGVLLRTTANRRAVTVEAGRALTLVGVDFDGESNVGLAQLRGGALTLQDVTTTATTAPIPGQPGGNIDAENATVWIERSTLDGAVSPVKDGGQIYALNSQVSVVDSVVRGGSAASGGGLFIQGGSLTIRDSTLSGHTAEEGAAIYADASDLVVEGTRFTGNHATVSSVVVCTSGPRCQVVDVTVEADRAVGPLLTITDSPASIHGSQWCRVSDAAGLMAVTGSSSLSMQGTVLQSSQTSGPALIITADAEAVLQNNTVALGEAATGGFIEADGPLVLTNNLLTGVSSPGAVVVARGGLLGGYNAYYGNVQADVDPAPLPTSLVGTDPGIGTPQSDSCALDPLRLRYGSPLVDGGDPSLFDTDKSRSDIGAFGGDAPNGGLDDVDLDGDGFSEPADCDDDDPFVNPAVAEALCNGTDDDCNPATLDDADADADGVSACSGDCDDDDPLVLPGSTEVLCNALDDDCDHTTLDAFWYQFLHARFGVLEVAIRRARRLTHRTQRTHTTVGLKRTALEQFNFTRCFISTCQHRADHYCRCARNNRFGQVTGETDTAISYHWYTVLFHRRRNVCYRTDLRYTNARYDSGCTDRTRTDTNFNTVSTRFSQRNRCFCGCDVATDHLNLWEVFLNPCYTINYTFGVTVRSINDNHVNTGFNQRGNTIRCFRTRTYRSTNDQTTLTIFSCIRVSLRFVHIVNGHHAAKLTVFVNNQNLLDTVFAQQVTNFIFIHTLFNRHQTIFRCHDGSNRCIQMIFKTHVTAGYDTNQLTVINHRETREAHAVSQFTQLTNGHIRRTRHRIVYDTGFVFLNATYFFRLLLNCQVLVDDTDTTFLRHCNRQTRFGYSIHCRRHQRDIQLNPLRQTGFQGNVLGQYFGVARNQQHIVKSKCVFSDSQHSQPTCIR